MAEDARSALQWSRLGDNVRVLLIEDSERLSGALAVGLRQEGFAVDVALDGAGGMHLGASGQHDIILLDLGLPVIDGMTVLRRLRASGSRAHVLILTARDAPNDIVAGLDAGADDYMTKPFLWPELRARLRALVRRRFDHKEAVLRAGELELDPRSRVARVRGEIVSLSERETAVLEYLLHRKGQTARHAEIEAAIYDDASAPESSAVTTIVCRLRKRLEGAVGAPAVRTVRGVGYRIDEPA